MDKMLPPLKILTPPARPGRIIPIAPTSRPTPIHNIMVSYFDSSYQEP